MPPTGERSLDLLVYELTPGNAVLMPGDPMDSERSATDPEHDLTAVLQPTSSLEDFDHFPRRHQPLEGTGALMPGEGVTSRHRQSAGAFDGGQIGRRR